MLSLIANRLSCEPLPILAPTRESFLRNFLSSKSSRHNVNSEMRGSIALLVILLCNTYDIYCIAFSPVSSGLNSAGFEQPSIANSIRRKVHIERIKQLQKSKDPRGIVKYVEDNVFHGKKGGFTDEDQEAVVQGMYSITKLQSPKHFEPLLQVWNAMTQPDERPSPASPLVARARVNTHSALRVLRLLTRSNRMADAERLCTSIGVHLHKNPSAQERDTTKPPRTIKNKDVISVVPKASINNAVAASTPPSRHGDEDSAPIEHTKLRALADMAVGYALNNSFHKTCTTLDIMSADRGTIDLGISKLIFRKFLENAPLKKTVESMRSLISLSGLSDIESNQLFLGKVIKSFDFIKGAVSLDTMPDSGVPEVTFMGRSNVGKSSLINLLSNRKKLAYTSKTPGKTSEFNYFEVKCRAFLGSMSNKIEHGASSDSSSARSRQKLQMLDRFHIVDTPGIGYAEKSKADIAKWSETLDGYFTDRPQLRCLFHLVDSRHGLLEADLDRLNKAQDLPESTDYCIVLTKVDKSLGPKSLRSIIDSIESQVYSIVNSRSVPILCTSSVDRTGTLGLWAQILSSIMN